MRSEFNLRSGLNFTRKTYKFIKFPFLMLALLLRGKLSYEQHHFTIEGKLVKKIAYKYAYLN